MSWIKNTGCIYHTQDTGYYCGAAAAMMILAEIGVPYSALDQNDLYNSNHSQSEAGWATSPNGLACTLNQRRPSSHYNFDVCTPTTAAEGSRIIVYTLYKYGVSPAALVYHCMHWIVVPGVSTDVKPVPGAAYTILGFWINNPVYHATPPPPPHSETDPCGTGGDLGTSNDFVSYAGWLSTYFTGCNYNDPSGTLHYISVCDPDVPDIALPTIREIKRLAGGAGFISAANAVKFSKSGLEECKLLDDKRVAGILKSAKPGTPQTVARLDKPGSYYQLVPWETAAGVTAFTIVDALYGVFHGINIMNKPIRKPFRTKEELFKQVGGTHIELPDFGGRLPVRPDAISLLPTLVWQPCQESYSPHLPFYQFNIAGHKLYVRIDGAVFSQLTVAGRGV